MTEWQREEGGRRRKSDRAKQRKECIEFMRWCQEGRSSLAFLISPSSRRLAQGVQVRQMLPWRSPVSLGEEGPLSSRSGTWPLPACATLRMERFLPEPSVRANVTALRRSRNAPWYFIYIYQSCCNTSAEDDRRPTLFVCSSLFFAAKSCHHSPDWGRWDGRPRGEVEGE